MAIARGPVPVDCSTICSVLNQAAASRASVVTLSRVLWAREAQQGHADLHVADQRPVCRTRLGSTIGSEVQGGSVGDTKEGAMNGNDVIVGVDGRPASDAALRWAAAEAERTGGRLRVVLVYRWRLPGEAGVTDRMVGYTREQAEAVVESAVAAARTHRPGITVSGHAVLGDGVEVLTGMATDEGLVVVGSHGHTALSAALHGGTGLRVAMGATGRVAVVRGRVEAAEGPVIVGVDGSHTDNRLLATAFEAAARRGCEVVAIRALTPPSAPWGVGIPPLGSNPVPTRATLHAELADDVQRWHEKYPTVPACARTPAGDPAAVLMEASGEAQLLVLGGRAHGPVAALLAGSVSHRLLHHAECPLLIVHDRGRT